MASHNFQQQVVTSLQGEETTKKPEQILAAHRFVLIFRAQTEMFFDWAHLADRTKLSVLSWPH